MISVGIAFVGLIILCLLLVKSSHLLLASLRSFVLATGVGAYGVATFALAFSTSLPELFVGVSAGIQGASALALGNILGSNIANLTLVLGLAALIAGELKAHDEFLKREVFYVFLAGSLPLLLLLDGSLGFVDGVLMILVYAGYNVTVLDRNRRSLASHEVRETPLLRRIWIKLSHRSDQQSLYGFVIGSAGMVLCADLIVRIALYMASQLSISVVLWD